MGKIKLYHVEAFMPDILRQHAEKVHLLKLIWSEHAKLELVKDRYGMLPASAVPRDFSAKDWKLIELETEVTSEKIYKAHANSAALNVSATSESITKYVFRRPVDATRSLVIVLRPRCCGQATVVTCWTNLNTDKHATLDKTKYEQA